MLSRRNLVSLNVFALSRASAARNECIGAAALCRQSQYIDRCVAIALKKRVVVAKAASLAGVRAWMKSALRSHRNIRWDIVNIQIG